MISYLWELAATIVFVLGAQKFLSLRNAFQGVSSIPGGRLIWFSPFSVFALAVAPFFPRKGSIGYYNNRFSIYERFGSTILASIEFWSAKEYYWLVDPEAIKYVTTEKNLFLKDIKVYKDLGIWGPTLVGTEGEDWKRHRAVTKSAFNDANTALVWVETIRIVNEWFSKLKEGDNDEIDTLDVVPTMEQLTLLIIAVAGFGYSAPWSTPSSRSSRKESNTGTLTVVESILICARTLPVKLLCPPSLTYLLTQLSRNFNINIPYISIIAKDTELGYGEMKRHLVEMVGEMRAEVIRDRSTSNGPNLQTSISKAASAQGLSPMHGALFRNLVESNMTQELEAGPDSQKTLTDNEMFANIFLLFLAGHETSAHSLSFALPLLALHPESQNKIFEEVLKLWPEGIPGAKPGAGSSFKTDFPQLEYTAAFFRETLRMFPSVPRLTKLVQSDVTLISHRFTQCSEQGADEREKVMIPIAKGSVVVIDIHATNYNPFEWGADAESFRAERFIDTDTYRWPRDAFLSFSAGPRGCVGSRFAMAESVCILALLVRHFEILVPKDIETSGMGEAEKRDTLLSWISGPTTTPTGSKVRLRSRM